jgi:hypothetical protein
MNPEKLLTAGMTVAFGLVLCGCSRSPAPPIQGGSPQPGFDSLASENDAIRRFHAVRGSIGFSPDPEERLRARRDLLRNCLARVNDTLRPQEKKYCIVFGNLSALDRDGDCWIVEVDQGLLGGQVAYFDDMGGLVLAWRAPEG